MDTLPLMETGTWPKLVVVTDKRMKQIEKLIYLHFNYTRNFVRLADLRFTFLIVSVMHEDLAAYARLTRWH